MSSAGSGPVLVGGMPRRLLVVITVDVADDALRELVRSLGGDDAEVLVVAPASGVSRLDWLTNAEDDAHAEAASIAEGAAAATRTTTVEAQVGDSDPLRAIEDALRTFPADEIVLVTRPDDQAGWLEEGIGDKAQARLSLPVIHVHVDEDGTMTTSAD